MQKIYGYARVSTREQNLDRQIMALREHVPEERDIINDKESGKDFDRPGWQMLRAGDTLVIKSLDRLSRSKEDIKSELEHFRAEGIRLKVLDLPTTTEEMPEGQAWMLDMINNILIEVMAGIAEQEWITTLRRQTEGIAAAKALRRHLGQPPAQYPSDRAGSITAVQAMDRLEMKKSTFYKMVRRWE